ncbi:MAG TPA: LytTR family transcriptional regulator [Saprospiraceae bacterium]|nr:LytTR family transcriptional regulator [Saprospiraceae bacterium]
MELHYNQKKLLMLTKKGVFVDSISWLIFYLLTLGFFTLVLWNQLTKADPDISHSSLVEFISGIPNGDWRGAFFIILRDGVYYTLFVMIIVYFNFFVLKRFIFDSNSQKIFRYGGYLLAVITTALIFGLLLKQIYLHTSFMRVMINYPTNVMIFFCVTLISTGMLHLRDLDEKARNLKRQKKRNEILREKLNRTSDQLQEMQLSISVDHLKVGSKNNYKIILFDDIILFKGDGNEPRIYTTSGKEFIGSTSMSEYQSLLPKDKFIRIHRSYIINKNMVIERKKNKFVLKGFDDLVAIGDTYLHDVAKDQRLGWESNLRKKLSDSNPFKGVS